MSLKESISPRKESKNLDTRWFREDKNEEEKSKTKEILLNSTIPFRLLKAILEEEFNAKCVGSSDLDKPNITERWIFNEGYKAALKHIYKTLP